MEKTNVFIDESQRLNLVCIELQKYAFGEVRFSCSEQFKL